MIQSVIVGVDPGYQYTGYGVISYDGERGCCLCQGTLDLRKLNIAMRLRTVFERISMLVDEFKPVALAVEDVFMARNASIAFKLGQVRATAIVAAALADVQVVEYAPRSIKQTITGVGAAEKSQVAYMTSKLLDLQEEPEGDAADALAIALCHAYHADFSDAATRQDTLSRRHAP
jgi:crossover junction endodeoxyribonuclease RuvC